LILRQGVSKGSNCQVRICLRLLDSCLELGANNLSEENIGKEHK